MNHFQDAIDAMIAKQIQELIGPIPKQEYHSTARESERRYAVLWRKESKVQSLRPDHKD